MTRIAIRHTLFALTALALASAFSTRPVSAEPGPQATLKTSPGGDSPLTLNVINGKRDIYDNSSKLHSKPGKLITKQRAHSQR